MADDDDFEFDDDLEEDQPKAPEKTVTMRRSDIRALERKAKTAGEHQARADKAERALAFAKAGIDLSDARTGYFVRGYEGDVSAEAIRKAAEDAGFLVRQGTEPPAQPTGQQDAAALNAMQQATSSGTTPPAVDHRKAMEDALNAGGMDAMVSYMRGAGLPIAED